MRGAAWVHIRDIVETNNLAPGNAGPVLLYDIVMPILAWGWPCHYGAARCRKEAVPGFFDQPEAVQLEYLPLLAPWFVRRHPERVERLRLRARRSEAP